METSPLAPWRDLAVMLLCVEAAIFVAIPGVILFFAQKYLRRFRQWLHLPFLRALVYALRVQHLTMRATDGVVRVPIAMHMFAHRVQVTAERLVMRRA